MPDLSAQHLVLWELTHKSRSHRGTYVDTLKKENGAKDIGELMGLPSWSAKGVSDHKQKALALVVVKSILEAVRLTSSNYFKSQNRSQKWIQHPKISMGTCIALVLG